MMKYITLYLVVVHFLYRASEITSIYTEILVQYHSKATDTVCPIKLKREEFLYIRTIFNFQAECVLIYMLLFYQISAWVFLIHIVLVCWFLLYSIRYSVLYSQMNVILLRTPEHLRHLCLRLL